MQRAAALGALLLLAACAGLAAGLDNKLPAASQGMSVQHLNRAVRGAGGSLDTAVLRLNEPVEDAAQWGRIAARVWPEEAQGVLVEEGGVLVVKLAWELADEDAAGWAERHAALTRAMAAEGLRAPVYVELSGLSATGVDPQKLVAAALDGVGATQRQPWADSRSASAAGWSALLPPGPYEVNVQAAARQTADGLRFWIGWPAVRSDY